MRLSESPRISIVSGGLDDTARPSIDACRALFLARIVFHTGCTDDVARWLSDRAKAAEIIDIGLGLGRMGPGRPNLYRATAMRIVVAARMHGEIVLIEPNRLLVTDLVTPLVIQVAKEMDVPVTIVPASPISNISLGRSAA